MKTKNTELKLEKSFKRKFIKALRSGKYEQGDRLLLNGKGQYCCLGVACVINGINRRYISDLSFPSKKFNLPLILKAIDDAGFEGHAIASDLAGMNDDGRSFNEIADYIQENL